MAENSVPQAPMLQRQPDDPSTSPQLHQASPVGEPLVCQWQGCQQPNHPSPEVLYDHVCENHIGRKSTNNLNLQCFWGSCRTTTVKRDHITSHIRVHVPLKPHKCDFCGKSFKRPQDLKKHVKTHADESVLFNSPQTSATGGRPPPNGYQVPGNADGSYGDAPPGHHMGYPYGNGQAPYHGGNGIPASGFGHYPYNVPQASSYDNNGLTESRKRAHDTLNDFFGEAKRRNIDAGQYQDLGARFSQFLQMFAPFAAGGWNGGYNPGFGGGGGPGYDNGGGGVQYQTQAAPPMSSYNPPFPELRTKNDLMSIDQFLEQLQHTVYDNEAAATGFQPVAGMHHQGFNFARRPSNSPPRFNAHANSSATPGSHTTSTFDDSTPALTPGSYSQTTHSPQTSHQRMSPNARMAGGSLYPTLPSFHSLENHNAFAGGPPTSLAPSGLGPQYEDYDARRRYSGGLLQRAQPTARDEQDKEGPGSRPGSAKGEGEQSEQGGKEPADEASPDQQKIKLPSVSEITREAEKGEQKEAEVKGESKREAWEQNITTIRIMRDYVRDRLARAEFDREEGSDEGNRTPRANQDVEMKEDDLMEGRATTPKREGASLYPVLRPVEA